MRSRSWDLFSFSNANTVMLVCVDQKKIVVSERIQGLEERFANEGEGATGRSAECAKSLTKMYFFVLQEELSSMESCGTNDIVR